MQSTVIRKLALSLTIVSTALLSASCVTRPVTVTTQNALQCGTLIPSNIRDDVAPVARPGNTQGDILGAFIGQTLRLEQANDEKKTVIGIVDNCEANRAKAIEEITKPWYQFW